MGSGYWHVGNFAPMNVIIGECGRDGTQMRFFSWAEGQHGALANGWASVIVSDCVRNEGPPLLELSC